MLLSYGFIKSILIFSSNFFLLRIKINSNIVVFIRFVSLRVLLLNRNIIIAHSDLVDMLKIFIAIIPQNLGNYTYCATF